MNRKGFTLIELLIVVVIIGILAAIAIPKFANTKEKAYLASMKSDLRNLVTAEEAYFADSVKYSASIGAGGVTFTQSTGNTAPVINTTADGWTANITNVNTTKTCSIYIGSTSLAEPKRTRLHSSHERSSYAVSCLVKKKGRRLSCRPSCFLWGGSALHAVWLTWCAA